MLHWSQILCTSGAPTVTLDRKSLEPTACPCLTTGPTRWGSSWTWRRGAGPDLLLLWMQSHHRGEHRCMSMCVLTALVPAGHHDLFLSPLPLVSLCLPNPQRSLLLSFLFFLTPSHCGGCGSLARAVPAPCPTRGRTEDDRQPEDVSSPGTATIRVSAPAEM